MYDNPYLNHLQYNYYPDMEQSQMMQLYNENPAAATASQGYLQQSFPTLQPQQVQSYISKEGFAYAPPSAGSGIINQGQQMTPAIKPPPVDPNMPTQTEIGQRQVAGSVTGAVDSVASAIPVYGQIYAGGKMLSGAGKSLLKKDEYGNVKGKFGQGVDALLTPTHENVINDAAAGKWGDAALTLGTSGLYKPISKWFS